LLRNRLMSQLSTTKSIKKSSGRRKEKKKS